VITTLLAACGGGAAQSSAPAPAAKPASPVKAMLPSPTASQHEPPPASATAPAPEPLQSLPLRITLTASKTELTPEEAKALMLSFEVTNIGTRPVHAGLEKSILLVNGRPHNGYAETLQDIKDDKWDSLAPGETARFHYRFSARGAVKIGEYSFVLQVGTTFSEPLVVRVVP